MITNVLLILPSVVKQTTTLHSNVTDDLILPEIKAVQDMYATPLLGSTLLNKILAEIQANTLADQYLTLVNTFLVPMMCNYVLSEMPEAINYQFTNKGLSTKTADQSTVPSMTDMYSIVSKYKSRAEHYHKRCRMYLIEKAPTLFPEYLQFDSGVDVVIPERTSFTCPIDLGFYEEKPKSYSDRYQGDRPRNIDY